MSMAMGYLLWEPLTWLLVLQFLQEVSLSGLKEKSSVWARSLLSSSPRDSWARKEEVFIAHG